ncbi:Caspase-1 [Orchesella cincta]|uniref:Caspase-1 n=1 Tax=Orchesella cincta TaxID=48709 RepID=A0A1D2MH06_ORCCI|nr:Caspase-1 [Orchesella cincta]
MDTMELGEGNAIEVNVNSEINKLKIAGSPNGNGAAEQVQIAICGNLEQSGETVDAFSFFGGNKEKKEGTNVSKEDDGDSKGFWGIGGGSKALMPVHKDSEVYNMNHPKRGRALILNHENFNSNLDLGRRYGTERDKMSLQQTFKNLGFDVSAFDDLTYHEVAKEVEKLAKEDHGSRDCLVLCVLSHGDTQLMYAKDYSYKPELLWQSFTADKCPTLAGKPKMFFVQACQGSQLDEGTKLVRVNRTETDSNPTSYRIPNHADFLIAYSTVPGFYSWRNTTNGSWFIQAICNVFNKYAQKKDLLSMMTIVAREVALFYESNTPSQPHMNQKKQIPFITSTLIRDVYLVPK